MGVTSTFGVSLLRELDEKLTGLTVVGRASFPARLITWDGRTSFTAWTYSEGVLTDVETIRVELALTLEEALYSGSRLFTNWDYLNA
jgi:hypothetical protein